VGRIEIGGIGEKLKKELSDKRWEEPDTKEKGAFCNVKAL